jgi:histone acetyltransferase
MNFSKYVFSHVIICTLTARALCQEADRQLDFNYTDEDIDSLRQQMKMSVSMVSIASPPIRTSFTLVIPATSSSVAEQFSPVDRPTSPASSVLSDEPPPSKRRRLSSSSLSDAEEEDDDEDDDGDDDDDDDKPLAAQVADSNAAAVTSSRKTVTQRSGKKTSSMKSKAQTAPTGDKRPEKNGIANGRSSDLKVKVEDKMDEGQLTRLATGVTVDTGPVSSAVVSFIHISRLTDAYAIQAFPQTRKSCFCGAAQGDY